MGAEYGKGIKVALLQSKGMGAAPPFGYQVIKGALRRDHPYKPMIGTEVGCIVKDPFFHKIPLLLRI
jgi:hypothetical protein